MTPHSRKLPPTKLSSAQRCDKVSGFLKAQAGWLSGEANRTAGFDSSKVLLKKRDGSVKRSEAPSRFNIWARRRHERRAERYVDSLTRPLKDLISAGLGNPAFQRAAREFLAFTGEHQKPNGYRHLAHTMPLEARLKALHVALAASAQHLYDKQG
ncbi:hypothetical protein [Hydrogenophaga sp. T2]|uniref:hypothetical protein n=1 Tax=Hydrogenophaga sp. T2 TaxID=3132823 RepID=UPI003CE919A9